MAIVRVNAGIGSVTAANNNSVDCGVTSLTAGNFIVACVRWSPGAGESLSTITDSAGNTFALLSEHVVAGGVTKLQIGYKYNAAGHASNVVTATFSGSTASYRAIQTAQYSGMLTTDPIDQTAVGDSSTGTITSGTFTTTQADELIFAGCQVDQLLTTFTAGGSASKLNDDGTLATSETIVSSIQTGVTASFTNTDTSSIKCIVVATFKAAAGGAPPTIRVGSMLAMFQ